MSTDHVLKWYARTIQSPYLHYGFWDEPDAVILSEITLADIQAAQRRYIEHLATYIPPGVRSVLDVGCGLGGNAAYLKDLGYKVETLSPDAYQETVIREKFAGEIPFHCTKFETFDLDRRYDLIFESESACYIRIKQGFEQARRHLNPGGYLLASDYFVYHTEGDSPLMKSSHNQAAYLAAAQEAGFTLVQSYDQTEHVLPTLDIACYFIERFVEPSMDYARYSMQKHYPKLTRFIAWLTRTVVVKKKRQMDLIRSSEFRKYRKYMIYLFQKSDQDELSEPVKAE
ncbi:MAG: SAM-dependent methyltransferase [Fidelibacterota bacterium]